MPKKNKAVKPKKVVKKTNPALEDDDELKDEEEVDETEDTDLEDEEDTEDEAEDETSDDDEEDEEDEDDSDEEEAPKAPKGGAKGAKAKPVVEAAPLIQSERPKKGAQNEIARAMTADAKAVKSLLEKQPKVRLFIPLGIGEKAGSAGAWESVTINGYRMVLEKGKYLSVPQAVADIIEAHYNMTPENTEMGEKYRLDRNRTKEDGMTTDEALNG